MVDPLDISGPGTQIAHRAIGEGEGLLHQYANRDNGNEFRFKHTVIENIALGRYEEGYTLERLRAKVLDALSI